MNLTASLVINKQNKMNHLTMPSVISRAKQDESYDYAFSDKQSKAR